MVDISAAQIQQFRTDGAICLRQVFADHWLQSLAEGIEQNFAAPGPYSTRYTAPGKPGGFYDDYCNWSRIAAYRDFIENSPAAEIAGRLTEAQAIRIYHDHVLIKEPGTEEVTPWHHDLPYYGVDGEQLCSIWLPLDPVPQAISPEFIAGSHNEDVLYYPRLFINHQNYAEHRAGYQTIPDIDSQRDKYRILSWDMAPGDCIVFHMRTLHSAPATVGINTRRRGFSTRWLGDDARFATRPWPTSPPFDEVDLQPGDEMVHPSFPLVWSDTRTTNEHK